MICNHIVSALPLKCLCLRLLKVTCWPLMNGATLTFE
jgi:hypothetical protein